MPGCDNRGCVCTSGCVKLCSEPPCVKVGAADPGSVVTVQRPFVRRPSAVNLLYSSHTKRRFLLWLLGRGWLMEGRWINNEGSGTLQTFLDYFPDRGIPLFILENQKTVLLHCCCYHWSQIIIIIMSDILHNWLIFFIKTHIFNVRSLS